CFGTRRENARRVVEIIYFRPRLLLVANIALLLGPFAIRGLASDEKSELAKYYDQKYSEWLTDQPAEWDREIAWAGRPSNGVETIAEVKPSKANLGRMVTLVLSVRNLNRDPIRIDVGDDPCQIILLDSKHKAVPLKRAGRFAWIEVKMTNQMGKRCTVLP